MSWGLLKWWEERWCDDEVSKGAPMWSEEENNGYVVIKWNITNRWEIGWGVREGRRSLPRPPSPLYTAGLDRYTVYVRCENKLFLLLLNKIQFLPPTPPPPWRTQCHPNGMTVFLHLNILWPTSFHAGNYLPVFLFIIVWFLIGQKILLNIQATFYTALLTNV